MAKSGGGGGGAGALFGGLSQLMDSSVKSNTNEDFKSRNANMFKFDDGQNDARKKLESVGFASGNPYAMIAAGVSAVGRQVDKAAKDEYGLYKSKAGEFLDNSFDIGNGIEFFKDAFDGKVDAEGIGNQLSLGLIGKSTRQRKLLAKKKAFEYNRDMSQANQATQQGTMIQNSLPKFKAPEYGLGIKSKFNGSTENFS
jgi:hypothetical protein